MRIEKEMERYFDRLFPICRSITGEGFQESLDIISEIIPLEKIDFSSGTECYDWTVPDEWNIRDAKADTRVKGCGGKTQSPTLAAPAAEETLACRESCREIPSLLSAAWPAMKEIPPNKFL